MKTIEELIENYFYVNEKTHDITTLYLKLTKSSWETGWELHEIDNESFCHQTLHRWNNDTEYSSVKLPIFLLLLEGKDLENALLKVIKEEDEKEEEQIKLAREAKEKETAELKNKKEAAEKALFLKLKAKFEGGHA